MPVANQKEMAVFRAEIQIPTSKSSTPNRLAIYIPPPTVTIQIGHWAEAEVENIKYKEESISRDKSIIMN